MFLKSIEIRNFRNHSFTDLVFNSRLIFFIGDNGEGKTNILEAVSLLSMLKSFRESDEHQFVKWNEKNLYVKGNFLSNNENHTIEFGLELNPIKRKKVKWNGELIKRQRDFYGIIPIVILSPPDLRIIDEGNEARRLFLDTLISSFSMEYAEVLIDYQRILKQRNASLKILNGTRESIELWNPQLVSKGIKLFELRGAILTEMNSLFHNNVQMISEGKDKFFIFYEPNINDPNEFHKKLQNSFQKDCALGYTSVGPHRDKIPIGLEGKDLQQIGSQGQKRSAVISLKACAFHIIENRLGEKPILIVDDVIRELDVKRREFFVEILKRSGQALFTTTDLEGIQNYLGGSTFDKEVFKVSSGQVTRVESA